MGPELFSELITSCSEQALLYNSRLYRLFLIAASNQHLVEFDQAGISSPCVELGGLQNNNRPMRWAGRNRIQ